MLVGGYATTLALVLVECRQLHRFWWWWSVGNYIGFELVKCRKLHWFWGFWSVGK